MRKTVFAVVLLCIILGPVFAADETAPPPPAAPTIPAGAMIGPRPMQTIPCISSSLRILQPSRMISTMAIKLQLTEEEKAKVQNLLTKEEEALAPKIEEQRKASEEYALLLVNESTPEADLKAAAEKAMKLEAEVLAAKIKTLYALKAMLRPEQNTQLAQLLKQFSAAWLPRTMQPEIPMMGNPGGMPPPPINNAPKPADAGTK